jgi:hypothetical protein
LVSSESFCFGLPPRSDPSDSGEEEELSVEDDELGVDEVELELSDGVWVGVVDTVVPLPEEELTMADELVEEVADADEEDAVTGVGDEVSDEVVVGFLLRALCKTSPRPRGLTALSIDCSTLSCAKWH